MVQRGGRVTNSDHLRQVPLYAQTNVFDVSV